jgi:plastocyanin
VYGQMGMRRLAPLAVLLTALLAACGGGGGGGGGGSQQSASSKSCPQGATVIKMQDIQFHPRNASVKMGDTVCWTNEDSVQHDAVADSGAFKSALFGKGQTFTWKADTAGTIKYVCTVHPNMTAELKVSS